MEGAARLRAVYLTGERVYIRAMVMADKEVAAAWFASPFPVNAPRAETWLKEQHTDIWRKPARHYVICMVADDRIVGGVLLVNRGQRIGYLDFHMAPWEADADALRADALRLIVPWVRDDLEWMALEMPIAADETATLAAAVALGMIPAVRLRGFFARPGGRVDKLIYQALNRVWEATDA